MVITLCAGKIFTCLLPVAALYFPFAIHHHLVLLGGWLGQVKSERHVSLTPSLPEAASVDSRFARQVFGRAIVLHQDQLF